ncbi:MAG: TlpA family protein disulfide reductase [Thermoleophilaceae bacterium]|nr:TlpA family protein disulfide reductase [Thermoleophilaceae bacterium]
MGRPGGFVAMVVLGLFVALLTYGLLSKAPDTTIDSSLAEAKAPPAPGFELDVLDEGMVGRRLDRVRRASEDGEVSLTELRGQPVVLNFWASWCPPCREEAPRLEAGWRTARREGVLFLGLDMQDLPGDARDFIREFELSYPQVRDDGDDVARDWGVTGLPETFFISRRGRVVAHVIGAVSAGQLVEGIRAAVEGRPLAALEGGARRSTR